MSDQKISRTPDHRDHTPPAGMPPLRRVDELQTTGMATTPAAHQTGSFKPMSPSKASRTTDTIRLRMVFAFMVAVLLPLTGLSLVSVISGAQGEREASIAQMENVLSYKENLLQYWAYTIKSDLGNALQGENLVINLRAIIQASPEETDSPAYNETVEIIRSHYRAWVVESLNFSELYVINTDGVVVLSTDPSSEGISFEEDAFFRSGQFSPFIAQPSFVPSTRQTVIIASVPIHNNQGALIGVLAGKTRLKPLNLIFDTKTGLGETGQTYLINSDGMLLLGLNAEDHGKFLPIQEIRAAMESMQVNYATFTNLDGDDVYGIGRIIPELQTIMVIEQAEAESAQLSSAVVAVNVSVATASVLVAIFISLFITRTIASPIADLADTARQIATGDLDVGRFIELPATTGPAEINVLSQSLDSMTSQLNSLITGLEERVAERTRDIEQRTNFLEASAQVSQATASILDPGDLMKEAVSLIQERFDLYYVGLFMVDEAREWAVLRAGTGSAGQAMLSRGHRLRVTASPIESLGSALTSQASVRSRGLSMIGWCVANAQARIAQTAVEDEVRFATPELPNTRSEAAIPLRSRGQVIGALSIQSERTSAFDQTFIAVLQSMADQLAVAIDNAGLFAESQQSLEAERRAYGLQTESAWGQILDAQQSLSFKGDSTTGKVSLLPTGNLWFPEMKRALEQNRTVLTAPSSEDGDGPSERQALAVPIRIRGQIVGVLDLSRPSTETDRGGWTSHEITLLENICDQLGIALESARLYSETQRRAEQERVVGEAASQMRQSLNIETVVKTAAEQIYKALGLDNLIIQLTPEMPGDLSYQDEAPAEPEEYEPTYTPNAGHGEEFSGEPS